MSQRRPPDEPDPEPSDADRHHPAAPGLRPQTRPAAPARGGKQEWGMTKPLDSEGLGVRPTPMRPEPGRAFGRGEGADEQSVKVGRAVYAGGPPSNDGEATRAPAPAANPPRPAQSASADRTHLLGSPAEPLRVPSQRPAPAPQPSNRLSAKATLLMTDSSRAGEPPGANDAARKVQPSGRAQPAAGVSADRQAGGTLSVDEADIRAKAPAAAPARAKPPESGAPRRGAGSTAPVPQTPLISGESEPLRLQLDAGDVLEQPVDAAPDSPSSGKSPTLVIVLAVIALVGGAAGIWYGMSGSAASPADAPPTRNDMQAAETAPAQPTTVQEPSAVPPAQNPAAAAGATRPQQAAEPTAVPPATAAPTAKADAEQPGAAPAKPAKADPPARTKRRTGGRARAPSGPVSPDVAAARDALRNLEEGGPVLRVEPSEEIPAPDEGRSDSPPAPPEPPPPDPE